MWDMNEVTKIEYKNDYIYHISFDDGINGMVDMVDFVDYFNKGPVFEPLRDLQFFNKATINGGTISCPNGADIAPETLYEKIQGV